MSGHISIENLNLWYGDPTGKSEGNHALKNVTLDIREKEITALIGPSGCGKSTCLRTLNRMNDLIEGIKITGKITLDGEDIYDPKVDVTLLRKKVGMVFQKPNPFPMSIYDNIAYGPRIHGIRARSVLDGIVESSLRGAALWNEVSDRLKKSAADTSTQGLTPIQAAPAPSTAPTVIQRAGDTIIIEQPCESPAETARQIELAKKELADD